MPARQSVRLSHPSRPAVTQFNAQPVDQRAQRLNQSQGFNTHAAPRPASLGAYAYTGSHSAA